MSLLHPARRDPFYLFQRLLKLLCPTDASFERLYALGELLQKLNHVSSGLLCKAELISWGWGGWIAISAGFFMAFVL